MKGRKPKPTYLKLIEGDPNKNRININEPKPPPAVPSCPDHLTETARAEWMRIVPELKSLGLLTNIDRTALAGYCQAYGRWVEAETMLTKFQAQESKGWLVKTPNGSIQISPLLSVINRAMEQMHKFLVEFGMTPSSRSRISVGQGKEGDSALERMINR